MSRTGIVDRGVKILLLVECNHVNPNGDPLNNRPRRDTADMIGYMSGECIRRKIRNNWQAKGIPVYNPIADRYRYHFDGYSSKKARLVEGNSDALALVVQDDKKDKTWVKNPDGFVKMMCERYIDIRMFGEAFIAVKNVTLPSITCAVSIGDAETVLPISIITKRITACGNTVTDDGKGSETMGRKYMIRHGLYLVTVEIKVKDARDTGLTWEDVELLKEALRDLVKNDTSNARPAGSMEVVRMYYIESDKGELSYNVSQLKRRLHITPKVEEPRSFFDDYDVELDHLDGCQVNVQDFW